MNVEKITIGLEIIVKDPLDTFRNIKPSVEVVAAVTEGQDRREVFAQLRGEVLAMLNRLVYDSTEYLIRGVVPEPIVQAAATTAPVVAPQVPQTPMETPAIISMFDDEPTIFDDGEIVAEPPVQDLNQLFNS